MREYSPKRRTALVLTGSGASGAYHAGAMRALDESGVKVDLVVGSGVGTVAAVFAVVYLLLGWLRNGRRLAEAFETPLDARPARKRLSDALWEVARGSAISADPPSEPELGKRFVALLAENLGQPGFRELILRAADLETGNVLPFVLLHDSARAAFASTRARGPRSRLEGIPGPVDLREPGHDSLLFDAVVTGLLPPLVAPVRRVSFPKGGIFGGETHRLTDATLAAGCGISEAIAAGAEQVIVASGSPHSASPPPRRRGPRAAADGMLATLERQALEE